MRVSFRDIAAASIGVLTIVAACIAMLNTSVDPGIHLAYQDGQVVVDSVDYASAAQRDGLQPGMVVTSLDGQDVLSATDQVKRSIGAYLMFQWSSLSVIPADKVSAELQFRADAASSGADSYQTYAQMYWYVRLDRMQDLGPIGLGLLIFILGWWWLGSGRAGPALRPYAVTLPLATAMPILILPVTQLPAFNATVAASILLAAGMVPLAFDFAAGLGDRRSRWLGYGVVLAFAAADVVVGLSVPMRYQQGGTAVYSVLWAWLAGSIAFVPGLAIAKPIDWRMPDLAAGSPRQTRLLASTELMLPAITPGISCISLLFTSSYVVWPILLWLSAIEARRLTLRPVMGLLGRTTRQRDLVVAATDAERARIAADIHDYALQDLTMLVRRLDAAGDVENAAATREVAERLRVICGDLRLPVLDDLGVGPALEWLCARFEQSAGHIALDRLEDEKRLPADAELAFFRVAQEAIANAARHGAPPVRVRYRGGGKWAELEVDDAGAGVPAGAAESAERTGHLGLMNMSQRAEAIAAVLSIGRRPGGGTRVRLVWEGAGPVGSEAAVADAAPPARGAGLPVEAAPPATGSAVKPT
jgi:signal transduction histidine kinase